MGRQSRQTRRAQERRAQSRGPQHGGSGTRNWSLIAGVAVVLAVVGLLAAQATGAMKLSSGASATPTISPGTPIAGIGCNQMEGTDYHIHAHISIYNKAKPVTISADTGHNYDQDCLYWLHSHDAIGIIHLEAPKVLKPPLSDWIKVQNATTPKNQNVSLVAPAGLTRKVWLNEKPYNGDPNKIRILPHRNITVEFGPPWVAPKKFDFKSHGI